MKVAHINLTERSLNTISFPQQLEQLLIGGKGVAARLLHDYVPKNADPLDPRCPLLFCSGPITGTPAPAMRGLVSAYSPLTGLFCDSYSGGHLFAAIKYAGWSAIMITGAASEPSVIVINGTDIDIKPAGNLWGKDTFATYSQIKSRYPTSRIACIGPAGENQVRYALIDCEHHRQAGRGGLGAVMGSKKLKAVIVGGGSGVEIADIDTFTGAQARAYDKLDRSPDIADMKRSGTASGSAFAYEYGFFPIENYSGSSYDIRRISPDNQNEKLWLQSRACTGCPIHCTKLSAPRQKNWQQHAGDNVEYESLGLLGGNLGISDPVALHYLNRQCDSLGLDTISAGSIIGWYIKLQQQHLAPEPIADLEFGNAKAVSKLLDMIANRHRIGDLLAQGLKRASKHLGKRAEDLACHIQGMETPAWGPRGSQGMALAYLTGDRGGCHQRGFPIAYELEGSWPGGQTTDGYSTEGKGEIVAYDQNLISALCTFVICDFGRLAIDIPTYLDLYRGVTGKKLSESELLTTGERIWNMIRLFNLKHNEKLNPELPSEFKRPLQYGRFAGHSFTDKDIDQLLSSYYRVRNWDQQGIPKDKLLSDLDVDRACKLPLTIDSRSDVSELPHRHTRN